MAGRESLSRRNFLKQASLGAAALTLPSVQDGAPDLIGTGGRGFTFLFQGDSITDGARSGNLDWNHVLGHGYVYLIAARLWFDLPTLGFHFLNRGVSGNTISDLAARWDNDTLSLKPDVVSILIGVNDMARSVEGNKSFTAASFQDDYGALLLKTRQQLPNAHLVLCEPFILPVGRIKAKWDDHHREISARQAIAENLALEFAAVYVPLQQLFNKAAAQHSSAAENWLWDGIHPMPNGHELIAREWIKHVKRKIGFTQ